jgi:transcription-repair coupling factor (superfamily II helicase)
MALSDLLDITSTSPAVQRVLQPLKNQAAPIKVSSLAGSSRSMMIAHAHKVHSRPTVVIVGDTESAEYLVDDLFSMLGEGAALLFPAWEVRPYDQISPDSDVTGQRISAMHALRQAQSVIVVTTVRAMMQRTLPPALFDLTTIEIKVGEEIPFEDLIARANRLGFDRTDMVQMPGQFSVRGGIVDIFPHTLSRPCRIEFFGDEIDSMRLFDIYTQRSTEHIPVLTMLPNKEVVDEPSARNMAAVKVKEAAAAQGLKAGELESQISQGGVFDGCERYLPFFHPEAGSLLSFIPDSALICFCEPSGINQEAMTFLEEYEEAYISRTAADDVVPKPLDAIEDWSSLQQQMLTFNQLFLIRSSGDSDDWININASNTGTFHGAMDVLKSRMKDWRSEQSSIFAVCDNEGQADRLTEILGEAAEGVSIPIGTLHAGFILPDLPLVVMTDSEIFSRYRRRRRRQSFKEGVVIEDFMNLKDRDYVVHIDHGIGRYIGLQRIDVDNRTRDCLTIVYAEEDRLYIPIEQLHRVQKYIGSDGEIPTLSRLGSKAWELAKTRTRKAVQDIAEDLIKLYAARQANPGFAFSKDTPWQREMEESFIFDETPDQLTATADVKVDMEKTMPMDRLICGDVGYGKTEVAIRAAFKAVMDGKQVAILVPTTILAQQHITTFTERLADYPVTVRMLSRFVSPKEQKQTLVGLKTGDVDIVIGTHRLISRDIEFKDLGLLVVDEEQRFGVTHKERLKQFKNTVDVMTMTATPIPRTLHMSLVNARDMSMINTPPRNRFPVHTEVLRFNDEVIREAILREVDRGGQVYFVHNRVQSIEAVAQFLKRLLPQVTFAIGHGQMPERDLERVMVDFLNHKYDCLVSTMIIESGLDISNVNTILINRADRFGLAQLYQIRGRVGRSNHRAYAYLMIPASGAVTPDARKRLAVISEYTALGSGFHIAMRDLEIRGAGNILGPQQHGFMASVGFDLYCRLLQEAVEELKGETREEHQETTIDLRVGAYIPDEYIIDRKLKVGFYQRLSQVADEEEIEGIREEMRDRFGRLPDPTKILLDLVSIKQGAEKAGLKSLTVRDDGLMITYPEGEYPTKGQITEITRDPSLNIEFPHASSFQIKIELVGSTEVKRVEMTKNILQSLI